MTTTPVEETNLPRYCIFRGRKVRIVGYLPAEKGHHDGIFQILDTDDTYRTIYREQIERFIK